MAKFKVKVEMEIELSDYYVEEGYNMGDIIEYEVRDAMSGSGIEVEDILDVEKID
ncbi:hypothetical protein ACU3L3_07445 [Priestia endophytica]